MVMQSEKRVTVTSAQVMKPFYALISMALILLVLWTYIDPWAWEREEVAFDENGYPTESVGRCTSETFYEFFLPLFFLSWIATSITLYMAWKTRDIPSDYSDSVWIFCCIYSQLLAWSFGFPLGIFIEDSMRTGVYIVRLMLNLSVSLSSMIFLIVPKVVKYSMGDRSVHPPRRPSFRPDILARSMLERKDGKEEPMMTYKKRHSSSKEESIESGEVSDPRSHRERGRRRSSGSQSMHEDGSVVSFGSNPRSQSIDATSPISFVFKK
jgi:hypothetical protein